MPEWINAAGIEQLPVGERLLLRVAGHEIALFNVQGRVYAIDDRCPHADCSLLIGQLDGTTVTCRSHGLRFDLADDGLRAGAGQQVRAYPVRVRDSRIEVDLAPAA